MRATIGIGIAIVYTFLLAYFARDIQRDDLNTLLVYYTVIFVVYILFLTTVKTSKLRPLIVLTVLFRLPFLFAEPALSDDIYRFEWDARVKNNGWSAYERTPEQFSEEERRKIDPDSTLFSGLNSPNYYSVYTPFNQLIFDLLSALSGGSWKALIIWYHLFFILIDVLAAYLLFCCLKILQRPVSESLIYLANPLLIIEGTGNFHFESIVACFILLAVFLLLKGRNYFAAAAFSLAAMLKLIPLILIPLSLRLRSWKWMLISASVVLIVSLSILPAFLDISGPSGFTQSLDLYFRSFEFNASFYYLFREIGFWIKGYNLIAIIGPALSILFIAFVLAYSWFFPKRKSFENLISDAVLVYLVYYLLSTTVHPWYIIPLLLLGVLGRWKYPVVWSLLIFLSYSHYNDGQFVENYILIFIEYAILLFAVVYEYRSKRKLKGISVSP